MKPRILIDINPVRDLSLNGVKKKGQKRVNLNNSRFIFIPIKKLFQIILVLLIGFSFIFGYVRAPVNQDFLIQAAQDDQEKAQLEAQLAELEKQISQYETTVSEYRTQGKTLQKEIDRLNAKIAKLNLQIKAISLNLKKLDQEINSTQVQISQTEDSISSYKESISGILQNIYEKEAKSLMEILLQNPKLSDFFSDLNNLLAVQDNLRISLEKIVELRQELMDQKEVLALEKVDASALKEYQDSQKSIIQKTKSQKGELLTVTKGQESKYKQLLTETKKTAAEVRKQIFKLIGGGELSFGEAYELAKLAEKTTGVRAALLLAVLDRESALGKNVGRCDYKTAMHPTRDIPVFLEIIDELGLKKSLEDGIIKVSCANSDGAYGGAMGPAQFIPSTWAIYGGYEKNNAGKWIYNSNKDRIAEITGNQPSSPWRNADAFMATALYLNDSGAGAGASLSDERKAAARYYAGSRWSRYLWTYGERVISQARQFEEDIAILSS